MEVIDSFSGEYRFLSNFWPCNVSYKGVLYLSTEHAYQAAKAANPEDAERIRLAEGPGKAKRIGSNIELVSNWEEVKLAVMENLVENKFLFNKSLGLKLLETGDATLIEGNHWGDTFWGVCNGTGRNELGKILMKIRGNLKDSTGYV